MSDTQVAIQPAKKLKTLRVKGTGKPDNKVLLFERHKDHPRPFGHENDEAGEIFVVNDGRVYTVAETPAIKRLIGEEKLTIELKGDEVDVEGERAAFNAAKADRTGKVAPKLRPATDEEEDNAEPPLTGSVEKDTAVVTTPNGIRRGGRPQ